MENKYVGGTKDRDANMEAVAGSPIKSSPFDAGPVILGRRRDKAKTSILPNSLTSPDAIKTEIIPRETKNDTAPHHSSRLNTTTEKLYTPRSSTNRSKFEPEDNINSTENRISKNAIADDDNEPLKSELPPTRKTIPNKLQHATVIEKEETKVKSTLRSQTNASREKGTAKGDNVQQSPSRRDTTKPSLFITTTDKCHKPRSSTSSSEFELEDDVFSNTENETRDETPLTTPSPTKEDTAAVKAAPPAKEAAATIKVDSPAQIVVAPVMEDVERVKTSHTRNEYSTYSESKLVLAGDVETQPGPKRMRKNTCMHTLSIILLLLLIINKVKSFQENTAAHQLTQQDTTMQNEEISHISCLLSMRRNQKIHNCTPNSMIMLLILAGDVKSNPGPKDLPQCIQCKEIACKETAEICETCKGWCHLQCTTQTKKLDHISKKNYEWICPNQACQPNFLITNEFDLQQTPNRYQLLLNNEGKVKVKKPMKKTKETLKTKKQYPTPLKAKENPLADNSLLTYLTKITPDDYIGKEKCKACHKTIGKRQRAISCDNCERWTHLKCSDMTPSIYKQMMNREFPWTCNTCRSPETAGEMTDITKLTTEELPITNQNFIEESNKEDFLILHYNCRSAVNKNEEIRNICIKLHPAILCLTETWLDNSSSKTALTPEGYKMIRNDRSDTYKQKYGKTSGGGTAILYREEIKIRKLEIGEEDQETQWVEVKGTPNFILGVVYKAQYTDLLDDKKQIMPLETQLFEANTRNNKIIVTGDLNCDMNAEIKDDETNRLEEMFRRMSMVQLITKPTRISSKNTSTTIDHVWTEPTAKLINKVGTIEGISDHAGQFIKLNQKPVKPEQDKIKFRNFKNYDKENFNFELKQELENSNFNHHVENKELNNAMNIWTDVFTKTAHKHAPMTEKVKKFKRDNVPWYTRELETKIEEKGKKMQLYRMYGTKKDLNSANKLTNEITHLKRKLKKNYYKQKIEQYEGDPKKMWRILKDITDTTPDKSSTEPEMMDQEKANTFNKYFATVGTEIQKKLGTKEAESKTETNGVFTFQEECEETIIKLIDRIRIDVAIGVDEINAKLLKDAKFTIAESLTKLVNLSFTTSTFPDAMKTAIIKAIHKKNSTEEASNYRPLSILPIVSKIFERAATDQLVKYLEENKILNKTQHAYRKKHSTQTCLMEIMDFIYTEREKGKIIGIASLDLSKAFDSISHSHLIEKMKKIGLNTSSLQWCTSYLENRKQKTKFKKFTSGEDKVTSGVPQGSILGPVLFICFMNDMADIFGDSKVCSYADDTQIIISGSSAKQVKAKLEELINRAQKWYTNNSLQNNAGKTETMIVGNKNNAEKIYIKVSENGKIKKLEPKKSIKILGIHIDEQLNWNEHIQNVRNKATNSIRNLNRINHLIPMKYRMLLYNSLVASHYNYVDTVWSGCGKNNEKRLQLTQNFAARSMLGLKKHTSATDALQTLKLLPLKDKRKVHEAVYVHKAMHDKLPSQVTEHYTDFKPQPNLRSASNLTLNIPKHKTQQYQHSPTYRTIKSWNSTPTSFRTEEITNTFKNKLQTHLLTTT